MWGLRNQSLAQIGPEISVSLYSKFQRGECKATVTEERKRRTRERTRKQDARSKASICKKSVVPWNLSF